MKTCVYCRTTEGPFHTGTPLSTESEAFMQATIDAVRRTPSTRWQRIRRWLWGPT